MEVIFVIILIVLLLIWLAPCVLAKWGMYYMRRMARKMGIDTGDTQPGRKQSYRKQQKKQQKKQKQSEKIFTDNEGTYIEYEEVHE